MRWTVKHFNFNTSRFSSAPYRNRRYYDRRFVSDYFINRKNHGYKYDSLFGYLRIY